MNNIFHLTNYLNLQNRNAMPTKANNTDAPSQIWWEGLHNDKKLDFVFQYQLDIDDDYPQSATKEQISYLYRMEHQHLQGNEKVLVGDLLEGITKGEWKQGYTMLTTGTRNWSKEDFAHNDEYENKMVFTNFYEDDKGKSRKLICTCTNAEDAKLIAKAPTLAAENKKLKEQNVIVADDVNRLAIENNDLTKENKALREILDIAMKSLATYGKHPLIEETANRLLNQ